MSSSNYKSLGLLFIAAGILIISRGFGLIPEFVNENLGLINIAIGLAVVFFTLGKDSRLSLLIGSAVFISGIQQFTAQNYEILNSLFLTAPVIFFSAGAGFLLLYFDNSKTGIFLPSALLLFLFGYLSTLFHNQITQLKFLNKFAEETLELWPLFFVLIGLSVLVKNRD